MFIDANQYLDLYRMVEGKKLLDSLEEQKAYIFVSAQIVDEVLRNKLRCARDFFSDKLKEIQTINASVPDHLLGISDQETSDFRRIIAQAEQTRKTLDDLVANALVRISRSEDDVSKRLGVLFDKSVFPSIDEMRRAIERKQTGNPPGKPTDALGDQITFEQLLTNCKELKCTRLWIITSDQDYCVKCGKVFLLNPLLRRNLIDVCGEALEIHCFGNLLEGITHFGKNADVKAEKLPTEKEAAEIKKEIEAITYPQVAQHYVLNCNPGSFSLTGNIAAVARTAIGSIGSTPSPGINPAVAEAVAGDIDATGKPK
ncbi:MAG: PIN domain-containing protein [Methylocystis sp.]